MLTEKPPRRLFAGIFLISLSIIMLELTLTRIFSVTMWYHFAFMSISIALFGIGVSGIYVYILPKKFPKEKVEQQLSMFALLFSISIEASFIIHLGIPFIPRVSLPAAVSLGLIYTTITIPFFFGGLCISLALTQFSGHVSKLYFSDLAGAGVGCMLLIPILSIFSAPNTIIIISIFACVGALIFNSPRKDRKIFQNCLVVLSLLVMLLLLNMYSPIIDIDFTKGRVETKKMFEKWNAFSRIAVYRRWGGGMHGWGLSDRYEGYLPDQLVMNIDAGAATDIIKFDGDLTKMEYLKYDVTSLAFHLKKEGRIFIIGPGGGRDVLTALATGQKEIYGIEINPIIVDVVNKVYGSFTGFLYSLPKTHIIIDDARSCITRSEKKFDIIQASLIDTWAATSAGAYTLTENNLYTKEAFMDYFDHLNEDGILTFSRWYFKDVEAETIRLVSIALAAMNDMGIKTPGRHLIVAMKARTKERYGPDGVGTMLWKKSPFTDSEIEAVENLCKKMGFEVIYTPLANKQNTISQLIGATNINKFWSSYPVDISASTDDKPFFFHVLRLKDFWKAPFPKTEGEAWFKQNKFAIFTLVSLLCITGFLCLLFIFVPLWMFKKKDLKGIKGGINFLLYFGCLGLGFMMIEIPLLQRFILFLGHPIYALSVVFFSLLLFSGIGSFLTNFIKTERTRKALLFAILALVFLLTFYNLFLPLALKNLIGMGTSPRIMTSVLFLSPLGLLLGMPFPLGIKLVNQSAATIIPWLWGINGAMSVFASVFAIVVAMSFGFTIALWIGILSYLGAFFLIKFLRYY